MYITELSVAIFHGGHLDQNLIAEIYVLMNFGHFLMNHVKKDLKLRVAPPFCSKISHLFS